LRQIEQQGGEPRISMLETIREFGLEQLQAAGEAEPIQHAHAAYFLAFATRANGQLLGPNQAMWLDLLEAEHDNLRAAFDWAVARREPDAIALRLAAELWRFWWLRGYHVEGRARAEAALARGDGAVGDRARALHAAGDLAQEQGDYECAVPLLEAGKAAAQEAGNARLVALCLTGLAIIATSKGSYGLAATFHEESLAVYRETGNEHGIAVALGNLGEVEAYRGDEQRANTFSAEAEVLYRKLGDRYGLATTLTNRGKAALHRGNYPRALRSYTQSLAIYRDLAAPLAAAIDTLDLGRAKQGIGDLERAGELYEKSLVTFRELGHRPGIAWALACRGLLALETNDVEGSLLTFGESLRLASNPEQIATMLEGVAHAAAMCGLPEKAARMLGAATALRDARESPIPALETAARAQTAARLHAALDPTIFAAAQAAGRALSLEIATAEALTIVGDLARSSASGLP
jgi:tetratricopeptide (TPR) repeat protein